MHNCLDVWLDRILPAHCLLCGLYSGFGRLCAPCSEELPRLTVACRHCALPCSPSELMLCGACLAHPPVWDEAVAAFVYDYPVDHLVQRFKFQRSLVCGQVLADELLHQILRSVRQSGARLPQVLLPVPLHLTRRFRRGFNQAEFLARQLGKHLGIPVRVNDLQRTRSTAAQSGLDRKARRKNLKGAFSCREMTGLDLALIDDVLTTGTTLGECAAVLKAAGAGRVSVWVAARVPAAGSSHRIRLRDETPNQPQENRQADPIIFQECPEAGITFAPAHQPLLPRKQGGNNTRGGKPRPA
jgi:ComF family protein